MCLLLLVSIQVFPILTGALSWWKIQRKGAPETLLVPAGGWSSWWQKLDDHRLLLKDQLACDLYWLLNWHLWQFCALESSIDESRCWRQLVFGGSDSNQILVSLSWPMSTGCVNVSPLSSWAQSEVDEENGEEREAVLLVGRLNVLLRGEWAEVLWSHGNWCLEHLAGEVSGLHQVMHITFKFQLQVEKWGRC